MVGFLGGIWLHLIEFLMDYFYSFKEGLRELSFVFGIHISFQVNVNKEVATLLTYKSRFAFDCNLPKCVESVKILELYYVVN